MMFHKFFLQHAGEPILFTTVSSAWVYATTSSKYVGKKRKEQQFCKDLIDSEDGLNYLVEYFELGEYYDGEKVKNMFKYYLKKKLLD